MGSTKVTYFVGSGDFGFHLRPAALNRSNSIEIGPLVFEATATLAIDNDSSGLKYQQRQSLECLKDIYTLTLQSPCFFAFKKKQVLENKTCFLCIAPFFGF